MGRSMVIFGYALLLGALLGVVALVRESYLANKKYEQVWSSWQLADHSSTLSEKSKHMDKFVTVLGNQGLQGTYGSYAFPSEMWSFDSNYKALKTLQSRMHEIKNMDPTTTQYQLAIQQITEQEQGGASEMFAVFGSCWFKVHANHVWSWNLGYRLWGLFLLVVNAIVLICAGGDLDYNRRSSRW